MKSIVTALVDPSGAADYGPDAYVEIWSALPVGAGGTIATDKPLRVPVTSTGLSTPPIRAGNYLIRIKLSQSRTALGPYPFTMPDGNGNTELWPLIAAGVNIPPDTPIQKIQEALAAYLTANPIEGGGLTEEVADTRYAPVSRAAKNPDEIAVGAVTRSANGAATGFGVVWDDGATGVFVGTESTSTPGAIDSYTVTHVLGGVTTTYTQPALTRNASGAVTARPAMTVS